MRKAVEVETPLRDLVESARRVVPGADRINPTGGGRPPDPIDSKTKLRLQSANRPSGNGCRGNPISWIEPDIRLVAIFIVDALLDMSDLRIAARDEHVGVHPAETLPDLRTNAIAAAMRVAGIRTQCGDGVLVSAVVLAQPESPDRCAVVALAAKPTRDESQDARIHTGAGRNDGHILHHAVAEHTIHRYAELGLQRSCNSSDGALASDSVFDQRYPARGVLILLVEKNLDLFDVLGHHVHLSCRCLAAYRCVRGTVLCESSAAQHKCETLSFPLLFGRYQYRNTS